MPSKKEIFSWVTKELIEEAAFKWSKSKSWFGDKRLRSGAQVRIRKYYIEINGIKFAPKHLLRLAYYLKTNKYFDEVVGKFSGGTQTNNVYKKLGFKIRVVGEKC